MWWLSDISDTELENVWASDQRGLLGCGAISSEIEFGCGKCGWGGMVCTGVGS